MAVESKSNRSCNHRMSAVCLSVCFLYLSGSESKRIKRKVNKFSTRHGDLEARWGRWVLDPKGQSQGRICKKNRWAYSCTLSGCPSILVSIIIIIIIIIKRCHLYAVCTHVEVDAVQSSNGFFETNTEHEIFVNRHHERLLLVSHAHILKLLNALST